MNCEIICGDNVAEMRKMTGESVHLVITSPPYDELREYGKHTWNFHEVATELKRLLVPGGVICWNVNDSVVNGSETLTSFRQALYFKDVLGLNIHDTMLYVKCNFNNPEQVRYHQLFEYVFIISKGPPATFNPIKDKLNKFPDGPWGKNTSRQADGTMVERKFKRAGERGMRGNVWYGNTRGQEDAGAELKHPAMMPKWLAEDLIHSWSNKGDVVLDPFAGGGTTGTTALQQGRNCILIEIDPGYYQLCREATRTIQTGLL